MKEDWLTVAQYAAELDISLPTVYRHIDRGLIPVLKIGSVIRIPRSALEVKSNVPAPSP